jgi:putative sugar O-methyltransferase
MTSATDKISYTEICKYSSERDDVFKIFKSLDNYKNVLEHVSYDYGRIYLDIILANDKDLLYSNMEKFLLNDTIGSPGRFKYEEIDIPVSSTTIRYIKILSDIKQLFGPLDGFDIVEIGGGYGGQCKIIMDVFNVNTYTIIDLPDVLKLTKKYLTHLGVDMSRVILRDSTTIGDVKPHDLLISNYAYSECIREVQLLYFTNVLQKSKHAYMIMNFCSSVPCISRDEYKIMIPNLKIHPEIPETHPSNVLFTW